MANFSAADVLAEADRHLEAAAGDNAWDDTLPPGVHLSMALCLATMAVAEELGELRRIAERRRMG